MTTGDSANINIVTEDSDICGRDGEGNLGQGGIQRFNSNDVILLVVQTESAKNAIDFNIGIRRPDTNVVSMLICYSRALCVQFYMDAIAVFGVLE